MKPGLFEGEIECLVERASIDRKACFRRREMSCVFLKHNRSSHFKMLIGKDFPKKSAKSMKKFQNDFLEGCNFTENELFEDIFQEYCNYALNPFIRQ